MFYLGGVQCATATVTLLVILTNASWPIILCGHIRRGSSLPLCSVQTEGQIYKKKYAET